MATKPKTKPKAKASQPAPAAPAAQDILSLLFGDAQTTRDGELALFNLLRTPLPGNKFSYGQDHMGGSAFHANTIGAVLAGLLQPQHTQAGQQLNGDVVGAGQETSAATYYRQLAAEAMAMNGGMGSVNPGASPTPSAGGMGVPATGGPAQAPIGASGKPVVTPKPVAIKPAPKITKNKITTQTAAPTVAPTAPAAPSGVTTGENGGFVAADAFKAPEVTAVT